MLVYRRPVLDEAGNLSAEKLCQYIRRHLSQVGPVFILGDFNCPNIDWTFSRKPPTSCESVFYDFFMTNGFTQIVECSTRGSNTLDIICVNEPILVSTVNVLPPFANSDHDSVEFNLQTDLTESSHTNSTSKRYLWEQGDYDSMCEFLFSFDWEQLFVANFTPDTIWSAFCEILDGAIDYVCAMC